MQPKLKLLRILDILRETDEKHPITAPSICTKLYEMGISAERKSVCRDIRTLAEYGYDIVLCHDNKLGYYMKNGKVETVKARPVTLDLVRLEIEFKEEDREDVYTIFPEGEEKVDGDYIISEVALPSSEVFVNLFLLGTKVKVTAPAEIKEEFEKRLNDISDFYKRRRDNGKMEVWLL